ncbi:hypothetical protein [Singulisphaera acidiphila]|uniref:Lipoprotein n=1 Tax=Singulisphaera acidiphila (strain ATCC BAA-1392 / DSM 18658 / VKM B-2454 / MOB10) TaxID=886293 RepID=L0D9S9_SINAD|nr:hypothetical protein [Singulisphaera acidiphila]AGA25997.1 hypothetical protein Sinac_1618 [Singulisphaera acidiphila DSM 18658]
MRRASVTSVIALLALLTLGGCSNGLEEGMPSNITETPHPPELVTNQMRDHAKKIGASRRSHGPTSNRPPGR